MPDEPIVMELDSRSELLGIISMILLTGEGSFRSSRYCVVSLVLKRYLISMILSAVSRSYIKDVQDSDVRAKDSF